MTVDLFHCAATLPRPECCYCRQDLLLPFRPMARRQNIPNKWDTTLCDNFATIAVPFPCPLPTVDFVFPHIAITHDS
jgi:hypothetical protein